MRHWHDALPTRAQQAIAIAAEFGWLPDLKLETVRAKTRLWWLRIPGVGKRTVEQIEALIGPLAPGPTEADILRLRDEAHERRQQLMLQHKHDEQRQQRDEQKDADANSVACLIDALIEMRPYLPEELP